MTPSKYSRKIDTMGRIMIPSKLREKYSINTGNEYIFYTEESDGHVYLCIDCGATEEIHNLSLNEAIEIIKSHGMDVSSPV
jgi:bifunctional DNA-binding transcriptional regulator/antitoxin component of YhaV-PrlF toxin-antitoxin module